MKNKKSSEPLFSSFLIKKFGGGLGTGELGHGNFL